MHQGKHHVIYLSMWQIAGYIIFGDSFRKRGPISSRPVDLEASRLESIFLTISSEINGILKYIRLGLDHLRMFLHQRTLRAELALSVLRLYL